MEPIEIKVSDLVEKVLWEIELLKMVADAESINLDVSDRFIHELEELAGCIDGSIKIEDQQATYYRKVLNPKWLPILNFYFEQEKDWLRANGYLEE